MDVSVRLFYPCAVLCAGSGLATGWSPIKGVLQTIAVPIYSREVLVSKLSRYTEYPAWLPWISSVPSRYQDSAFTLPRPLPANHLQLIALESSHQSTACSSVAIWSCCLKCVRSWGIQLVTSITLDVCCAFQDTIRPVWSGYSAQLDCPKDSLVIQNKSLPRLCKRGAEVKGGKHREAINSSPSPLNVLSLN
jgi:hypothetical protein